MTLYYLDLDECGSVARDDEGVDLPDLASARALAIRNARSIMAAETFAGHLCLGCKINVRDVFGRIILTVPFRDAVIVDDC